MGLEIVTAAPPTPNGDLHLGHIAGPYSGADIYARACRLRGGRSVYATGSDVHQSYVASKAGALGAEPLEMAQGFADEIAEIFAAADFAVDSYIRPQHSPQYRQAVDDFVRTLYERGTLARRTEACLYCERCGRYLFEAYVAGGCPVCGCVAEGNCCEHCARPNSCTDLIDPRCTICHGAPAVRAYERLVLPLAPYIDRLVAYHRRTAMSPQLRELCRVVLEAGPVDIAISHPTDWGIPVPVGGFADQRIDVWAEMVPGYFVSCAQALAAAGEDPDRWHECWNATDTELVQFFGFDNGFSHAIGHPALMMAYDDTLRLPSALITNEFYLLEAAKFSTSRRHAIWAADLLAHVPADVVRFVLAHDRPESERTDFTWQRFRDLAEGELVGRWQRWLGSLFNRMAGVHGGRLPDPGVETPAQRLLVDDLTALAERGDRAYRADGFSPQLAARTLNEIVRVAHEFSAAHDRLYAEGAASPEAAGALAGEVVAAHLLAQLAAPIMPTFARRLWRDLGCTGEPVRQPVGWLPVGRSVAVGGAFFEALPVDLEAKVMGT